MSLWIILTVMISVASVFAAAPFIRRREQKRLEAESQLAVYLDQLKEVEIEAAQGAIDETQAASARTEIKRRMIAAGHADDATWPPLSGGERAFAAIAVSATVAIGSAILFSVTADFGPSPAPAQFGQSAASDIARLQSLWGQDTQPASASPAIPSAATTASAGKTPLPPVEELIQRLVTRLQRNPKDVEGWRMLGWSYYSVERFNEAAAAYARAIELNPASTEYRDGRIEAMLRAANGVVTPDVRTAMEETLKIQPKDPRALYIKGLAIEQGGDRPGAEAIWNGLLAELDPADPWSKEIARKISGEPKEAGQPAGAQQPQQTASAPTARTPRGPSADDVRAAENMAPSDRMAMIQRMVDGLAERLEASPRDADSWIRLIRSWTVLGDKGKALQSLEKAIRIFSDDPAEAKRIADSASEAGVSR